MIKFPIYISRGLKFNNVFGKKIVLLYIIVITMSIITSFTIGILYGGQSIVDKMVYQSYTISNCNTKIIKNLLEENVISTHVLYKEVLTSSIANVNINKTNKDVYIDINNLRYELLGKANIIVLSNRQDFTLFMNYKEYKVIDGRIPLREGEALISVHIYNYYRRLGIDPLGKKSILKINNKTLLVLKIVGVEEGTLPSSILILGDIPRRSDIPIENKCIIKLKKKDLMITYYDYLELVNRGFEPGILEGIIRSLINLYVYSILFNLIELSFAILILVLKLSLYLYSYDKGIIENIVLGTYGVKLQKYFIVNMVRLFLIDLKAGILGFVISVLFPGISMINAISHAEGNPYIYIGLQLSYVYMILLITSLITALTITLFYKKTDIEQLIRLTI